MKTLRGSILEESVPSAARHTTPRGLSPKRLLEFIMPELNLHCLRLASNSPKVRDTLLKLDEQGVRESRGRQAFRPTFLDTFTEGQSGHFTYLSTIKWRFGRLGATKD